MNSNISRFEVQYIKSKNEIPIESLYFIKYDDDDDDDMNNKYLSYPGPQVS